MLHADGIAEILADSRARVVAVSSAYRDAVAAALGFPWVTEVMAVVTDALLAGEGSEPVAGLPTAALGELTADGAADEIYPTTANSPAFWLYTSGTTGTPKGAMHRHGSVRVVCETYGAQVLGITPEDRCLSAAKALLRLRPGELRAVPDVGRGEPPCSSPARPVPRLWPNGRWKSAATLFFAGPHLLFQHAARRAARGRPGRGAAGRLGWRGAPRPRCTSGGRRTSAWTSSTASA